MNEEQEKVIIINMRYPSYENNKILGKYLKEKNLSNIKLLVKNKNFFIEDRGFCIGDPDGIIERNRSFLCSYCKMVWDEDLYNSTKNEKVVKLTSDTHIVSSFFGRDPYSVKKTTIKLKEEMKFIEQVFEVIPDKYKLEFVNVLLNCIITEKPKHEDKTIQPKQGYETMKNLYREYQKFAYKLMCSCFT